MKVKNGHLDAIGEALADLGANRLPYRLSDRISKMKRCIVEAIKQREAVRNDIGQSYMPAGTLYLNVQGEAECVRLMGAAGYVEALGKLNELLADEIELDLGAPLNLCELSDDVLKNVVVLERSTGVLREHGLVVTPP